MKKQKLVKIITTIQELLVLFILILLIIYRPVGIALLVLYIILGIIKHLKYFNIILFTYEKPYYLNTHTGRNNKDELLYCIHKDRRGDSNLWSLHDINNNRIYYDDDFDTLVDKANELNNYLK